MRESKVERRLVQSIGMRGGKAVKWVAPGERGVPDRIVIMPEGKVYFVELKSDVGVLHPLQQRWINKLLGLKHKAFVVRDETSLLEFLKVVDRDAIQSTSISTVCD